MLDSLYIIIMAMWGITFIGIWVWLALMFHMAVQGRKLKSAIKYFGWHVIFGVSIILYAFTYGVQYGLHDL